MKQYLRFCLSVLEENIIHRDPMFLSIYNFVHIDEKWSHMSKKSTNYYLIANEDDQHQTYININYMENVKFLVVVLRPRFDDEDNVTFT